MAKSSRTQYSDEQKEMVRTRYPLCRTLEDKWALARELNMDSIHKLYNLASRLGATRTNEPTDMPADDPARLRLREIPSETVFSDEDDRFLRENFGRQLIERIAYHRGHTETAMLYRARVLGLRQPVRLWPAEKVVAWLGYTDTEDDWKLLDAAGVDRLPLADSSSRVRQWVVTTSSLLRFLGTGHRWQELVTTRGADEFFCREILETGHLLQRRETHWESCRFLSAGHTCLNPCTMIGHFCTNTEKHRAGEDEKCDVRHLGTADLHPRHVQKVITAMRDY